MDWGICSFPNHRGGNWLISKINGGIVYCPKHKGSKMLFLPELIYSDFFPEAVNFDLIY